MYVFIDVLHNCHKVMSGVLIFLML